MAKVIFEFDDCEENNDINLIVNRHKLYCAINALNDFYRNLYNGKLYTDEIISVKDNKVLTEEDYAKFREEGNYPVKGTKQYISTDYIEDELNSILDSVNDLLDY